MQDLLLTKKHILIVGDSGRGKTNLAHKISKINGITVYEIDDVYWKVKFTQAEDSNTTLEKMKEIYNKEEWIVEGSSDRLSEIGFGQADLIIHLYFRNFLMQIFIILRRYFRRINKHPETIKSVLVLLRFNFYKRYKFGYKRHDMHLTERLMPYKSKTITLKSFKEINNFIKSLNS